MFLSFVILPLFSVVEYLKIFHTHLGNWMLSFVDIKTLVAKMITHKVFCDCSIEEIHRK